MFLNVFNNSESTNFFLLSFKTRQIFCIEIKNVAKNVLFKKETKKKTLKNLVQDRSRGCLYDNLKYHNIMFHIFTNLTRTS